VLPVDTKSIAQGSSGFVDAASRKQRDRSITCDGRGKMPIFGQQDPMLVDAASGDCAVGESASGNHSVVTGRPQPSAETVQHLVTQKPRHLADPEPHRCGPTPA
jgi:hypothetical protein